MSPQFSQFVKILSEISKILAHSLGLSRYAAMVSICTLSLNGMIEAQLSCSLFIKKHFFCCRCDSIMLPGKICLVVLIPRRVKVTGEVCGFAGNSHSLSHQSSWTGTGHGHGLSAMLSGRSSHTICSQMPGFAQSYLFLLFFLPTNFHKHQAGKSSRSLLLLE